MRKTKQPSLFVERLEGRQLLSSFQQPRMYGYRPDDAAMTSMLGMPPMTPPAPTGKPGISLIGGSANSIGGSAGASVTPGIGNTGLTNVWAITKVVYSASGALGVQTFDTSQASSSSYSGYTANYPNGVQQASASWFWDESPGEKTISVSVTYNDPGKTTLSGELKVNVAKPVVDEMKLSGRAYHVGARDGTDTYYGITNNGPDYQTGVTFNATVSAVPSGGEFAFVQVVTKADIASESALSTKKRTTPPGSQFLDAAPGQSSPAMNDSPWKSLVVLPASVPTGRDTPGLYCDIRTGVGASNYKYSLSIDYAFDTYLVWRPSGGAYVAVDHISWSVNATATFNGNLVDAGARGRYKDPANWTITSNHAQDWEQTGDHTTKILTWTDNADHGLPPIVTTPKN